MGHVRCVCTLTVLLQDQQHAGEDLHDLGQHHGRGGQVPRAVGLQGAGVAHGEHQGGRLKDQHTQREVLQPGGGHVHRGAWPQKKDGGEDIYAEVDKTLVIK